MAASDRTARNEDAFRDPPRRAWEVLAAGALIVAAGAAAYSNSFHCAFVFDDLPSIVDNPALRWPGAIRRAIVPPPGTTQEGRPVVNISLAVNYALGGLKTWGYHAFNLTVHLLAALTLFGIVRRTLALAAMRERLRSAGIWLAGVAALLWAVHPLQTESVTYVIQRAESLMGLFYLVTLYCFIRGLSSRRAWLWHAASVAACATGMGSKEVMVTAPAIVLLYDAVFVAGSLMAALKARRGLYPALAATWAILAALAISTGSRGGTAGLGLAKVTPLDYALTQLGVILHYLRLSFWPGGLCLDYSWPVARGAGEILPAAAVVGLLLAATVWALASSRRAAPGGWEPSALSGQSLRAAWGFLGGWFFITLAPSSSIMPVADLAFEHRMYLPLAAVTTGLTVAGYLMVAGAVRRLRLGPTGRTVAWGLALVAAAAAAGGLGGATFLRNSDYRTGLSMYQDAARKRPNNARAHSNLAYVLIDAGEFDRAVAECSRAIELSPDFAEAYNNRGLAFAAKGQHDRAIADYKRVIELQPDHAEAHNNRAASLTEMGRYDEAIASYIRAIKFKPDYADAYANLGAARHKAGSVEQAVADYTRAIQLKPDSVGAHNNRGYAYAELGRFEEAMADFAEALRLDPNDANTYDSRAFAYYRRGWYDNAWEDVRTCRKLGGKPDPNMVQDLIRASGREE